jgi:hypothetical protein
VIGEKGFQKREFVVETEEGMYPQSVQFQLTRDNAVDPPFEVGAAVSVYFNVRGRAWTKGSETKYFNTLEAWRVTPYVAEGQEGKGGGGWKKPKPAEREPGSDDGDDLSF